MIIQAKDEGIYCYGGKNKKGKIYSSMMVLRFTKATPSCKQSNYINLSNSNFTK